MTLKLPSVLVTASDTDGSGPLVQSLLRPSTLSCLRVATYFFLLFCIRNNRLLWACSIARRTLRRSLAALPQAAVVDDDQSILTSLHTDDSLQHVSQDPLTAFSIFKQLPATSASPITCAVPHCDSPTENSSHWVSVCWWNKYHMFSFNAFKQCPDTAW